MTRRVYRSAHRSARRILKRPRRERGYHRDHRERNLFALWALTPVDAGSQELKEEASPEFKPGMADLQSGGEPAERSSRPKVAA